METTVERSLEVRGSELTERAADLIINNKIQYELGDIILSANKALMQDISGTFGPMKSKAWEAHKEIVKQENKFLDPCKAIKKIVDKKMTDFYMAEKRKREEKERIEREAMAREEEEIRLAQAEKLEAAGATEEAEAILDEPIIVPKVEVEDDLKLKGESYRSNWKYRVIDEDKVPNEYKMLDLVKIGKIVRALKNKTNIPGIEVFDDKSRMKRG